MSQRRRYSSVIVAVLFLTVSLTYICRSFQWGEIWNVLRSISVIYFAGFGSLSIVAYWLVRAFRWQYLMRTQGVRVPFRWVYLSTSIALGMAIITPFQSGEVAKVELLKKIGAIRRMPGYASLVLERFTDLFVIVTMSLIAIASMFHGLVSAQAWWLICIGASAGVIILIGLMRRRWTGRVQAFFDQMRMLFRSPAAFWIVPQTVLAWAVVGWGWHVCFRVVGIQLSYLESLRVMATVTLINILSLLPGAVGISSTLR